MMGNKLGRLVGLSGATDLAILPPRRAGYDWVDPRVVEHIIVRLVLG